MRTDGMGMGRESIIVQFYEIDFAPDSLRNLVLLRRDCVFVNAVS